MDLVSDGSVVDFPPSSQENLVLQFTVYEVSDARVKLITSHGADKMSFYLRYNQKPNVVYFDAVAKIEDSIASFKFLDPGVWFIKVYSIIESNENQLFGFELAGDESIAILYVVSAIGFIYHTCWPP